MKLKRLKCASLCFCMAVSILGVAGCSNSDGTPSSDGGSSTPESEQSSSGASGDVDRSQLPELHMTFVLGVPTNDSRYIITDTICQGYQQLNPNFTYEIQGFDNQPDQIQHIQILASSNELPSWWEGDKTPFHESLAEAGKLVNVGDFMTETGLADRYLSNLWKTVNEFDDGELYFFCTQMAYEYWYYHPSHFEAAGIEEVPTTYDEFFEACEKLKSAGYAPISFGSLNSTWYVHRYAGMIPFDLAGNDFVMNLRTGEQKMNSPVGIESAEWMQKMAQYFCEGWAGMDYQQSIDLFLGGGASMWESHSACYTQYSDPETGELNDDIAVFRNPVYSDRDVVSPNDFYAAAGTGNVWNVEDFNETFQDFVKYYFDEFPDLAAKEGILPLMSRPDGTSPEMPSFFEQMREDLENLDEFCRCWDVTLDPATVEVVGIEGVSLMMGDITPEEYCQRIDDSIAQNASTYFD